MEKLKANFIPFFDYKILTKIISNRLKTTLDQVISKEQTYSVPNRSIFSNLFTISELIYHSNTKNIQSYIVSIDQEKSLIKSIETFCIKSWENLVTSRHSLTSLKKSSKI